jgi:hypothetical protein
LWAAVVIGVLLFRSEAAAASGQLDLGFYAEPNAPVYACATAAAYGTVLIGGDFTYLGPYTRNHIALLTTKRIYRFSPPQSTAQSMPSPRKRMAKSWLEELLGVNRVGRIFMARLNADGTLDTGYLNPKLNGIVRAIAVQPDQKILAAGTLLGQRILPILSGAIFA